MRRRTLGNGLGNKSKSDLSRRTFSSSQTSHRQTLTQAIPGSIQDPRDFKKKTNKISIIKRLLSLFKKHQTQHSFTVQNLLNIPLTTDVYFIFEFLFQVVDPNYRLKFIEVLPMTIKRATAGKYKKKKKKKKVDYKSLFSIIKMFNYQGKLRENDLKSLLPFSWNNCLFVIDLFLDLIDWVEKKRAEDAESQSKLTFLEKLDMDDESFFSEKPLRIKIDDDIDMEDVGDGDDNFALERSNANSHQIYEDKDVAAEYEIMQNLYPLFMQGEDKKISKILEKFSNSENSKKNKLEGYVTSLKSKINDGKLAIQQFSSNSNKLLELRRQNKKHKNEIRRKKKRKSELIESSKALTSEQTGLQSSQYKLDAKIEENERKEKGLRIKVPNYLAQMSKDEILQMKKDKNIWAEKLGRIKMKNSALDNELWKLNEEFKSIAQKNELMMTQFNNTVDTQSTKIEYSSENFLKRNDVEEMRRVVGLAGRLKKSQEMSFKLLKKRGSKGDNDDSVDLDSTSSMDIEKDKMAEKSVKELEVELEDEEEKTGRLKRELMEIRARQEKEMKEMEEILFSTANFVLKHKQNMSELVNEVNVAVKKFQTFVNSQKRNDE